MQILFEICENIESLIDAFKIHLWGEQDSNLRR